MEFGLFDESYSPGYNEENDFMMRANRCGYRSALGESGLGLSLGRSVLFEHPFPRQLQEDKNAELLNQRYPEYKPSVRTILQWRPLTRQNCCWPAFYQAGGRLDLLFDFSSIGLNHNGTFVASKRLLESASKHWPQFNLYVMISKASWKFHQLDQIGRVQRVPIHVQRTFAVAFRFAQPFSLAQMSRLSRLAPLNVYGMLDPIAFDCLYLNSKNADDLETLWGAVFAHVDGIIYISDFVAELFRRRFRLRPGLNELVAYPSLDFGDYRNGTEPVETPDQHILVIGNRFEHKRVQTTTQALSNAFPEDKIVALGFQHEGGPNVVTFDSGPLEEGQLRELLAGARFVVFPSTYEGFGFPVLESLACENRCWSGPSPCFEKSATRSVKRRT